MLISTRTLGKFSKEYEHVTLRKIVDNISSGSFKQYDVSVGHSPDRCRASDNYPTYDPKKDTKKTPKHLAINRDEYLTLLLHLFKNYFEVYRIHELQASLLTDANAAPDNEYHEQLYKNVHQKFENEKNHRMDFDQLFKDWKQLKATAKDIAATDMIPALPLVECKNVYLDPSEFPKYREDMDYLVKLKEIIEQNIQLGDSFKNWRTTVNEYLPS